MESHNHIALRHAFFLALLLCHSIGYLIHHTEIQLAYLAKAGAKQDRGPILHSMPLLVKGACFFFY